MPNLRDKPLLLAPVSRPLVVLIGGQSITALAGLLHGKLTAVYIPPTIWGDYTLLFVGMTLLQGLFVAPTVQSFKAALAQFPPQRVVAFYGRMAGLIYGAIALLLTFLAGLYRQPLLFGLIWITAVGQGVYQFGHTYLNASGQHRNYALLQAGYAIGTVLGLAFIVIGLNDRTVTGLWLAFALVNSLLATATIGWFVRNDGPTFRLATRTDSTDLRRRYKQYVGPLLSLAFWSWLINYADRYLIRLYLTDADVGQYAMGYSLGSKLLWLVAPLLAFLSPQVLHLRAAGQSSETANRLIGRYLIRYVLLAGVGCWLFYGSREWIGQWLLSDHYAPAFAVGPIVAMGYLFLTSTHLIELKWYAFGKTRFILWHNMLGAFLNIGFNFLLIPRLGIEGAALATLLGFAGQFLLAMGLFSSEKSANP